MNWWMCLWCGWILVWWFFWVGCLKICSVVWIWFCMCWCVVGWSVMSLWIFWMVCLWILCWFGLDVVVCCVLWNVVWCFWSWCWCVFLFCFCFDGEFWYCCIRVGNWGSWLCWWWGWIFVLLSGGLIWFFGYLL